MSEINPPPEPSVGQSIEIPKPEHRGCMAILFGFFGFSDAYDLVKWLVAGEHRNAAGWQYVVHGFMFATVVTVIIALVHYRKPAFNTWIAIVACAMVSKSVTHAYARKDWVGLAVVLGVVLIAGIAMVVQRWISAKRSNRFLVPR